MKTCLFYDDFSDEIVGLSPSSWNQHVAYERVKPVFRVDKYFDNKVLLLGGSGQKCVGYLSRSVLLQGGQNYQLTVEFEKSDDLNPQKHLLFSFHGNENESFNHGVFTFYKMPNNKIVGKGQFRIPGKDHFRGEIRLTYRLNPYGKAWINYVKLMECEEPRERNVRIACVAGSGNVDHWRKVLEFTGNQGVDLTLLPEYFLLDSSKMNPENNSGPTMTLLAEQAAAYNMYTAGGLIYEDPEDRYRYNAAVIFDRTGKRIGMYYKNHCYSPELNEKGIMPGESVETILTDFGKIGFMICYDGAFTDVSELLSLQGAEIILYPNANYYRSLMPARSADNNVRIVASTLNGTCGIWDTSGADIENPFCDPTRASSTEQTYKDIKRSHIDDTQILMATLDLSKSPSQRYFGGPMASGPGNRRNRREQTQHLYRELERWQDKWSEI